MILREEENVFVFEFGFIEFGLIVPAGIKCSF